MTTNVIRPHLQRLDAPTAHAWRRGRAIQALADVVSVALIGAAIGSSCWAMVSRFICALSGQFAVEEFQTSWSELTMKISSG